MRSHFEGVLRFVFLPLHVQQAVAIGVEIDGGFGYTAIFSPEDQVIRRFTTSRSQPARAFMMQSGASERLCSQKCDLIADCVGFYMYLPKGKGLAQMRCTGLTSTGLDAAPQGEAEGVQSWSFALAATSELSTTELPTTGEPTTDAPTTTETNQL
jgi:hypothetical protein